MSGEMSSDCDRQALERRRGSQEGESFDRRLREIEGAERQQLLDRAAPDAASARSGAGYYFSEPPSLHTLQLQREVDSLKYYYNAVQGSRAWRLTQGLRRLVGRAG
jgi:hypothetical protein